LELQPLYAWIRASSALLKAQQRWPLRQEDVPAPLLPLFHLYRTHKAQLRQLQHLEQQRQQGTGKQARKQQAVPGALPSWGGCWPAARCLLRREQECCHPPQR